MVRADEQRRIALLVAAHLHAAMPARIQEHVHDALLVAAQDDRLLAHARGVEVAGLGNQALVPDEQPGAGEQLLQFLLVEIGINEDFAANEALVRVNELVGSSKRLFGDIIVLST